MFLKPEEVKIKVYKEHKEMIDLAVRFMMSCPPADKVLDILKEICGVGYGQGMAEGAELIAKRAEYIRRGDKIIEEGLK